MRGQLLAAVPGQRADELVRQGRDRVAEQVLHRDRTVASEGRAVLRSRGDAVALVARELGEHRVSGGSLDQVADRGSAEPDDEVALQVSKDSSVGGFRGSLADQFDFVVFCPHLMNELAD